jgi:hypothetical protein
MGTLFTAHRLNDGGFEKAQMIEGAFERFLQEGIEELFQGKEPQTREWALAKTKLEEASFYVKKTMALQTENQQVKSGAV